ncbi:MAG: ATP-binding protein [Candidatus Peregrinibacteria bacterium]
MTDPILIPEKIRKKVSEACIKYDLIEEGDRILVGLSGGKDSTSLLHILKNIQRFVPFDFHFEAAIITYGMGENYAAQVAHCEAHNIPVRVVETEIFEIAKTKINENSSFCSFFSRMRRGMLSKTAQEQNCNKLALGHHLDDAVESFFMNSLYNGHIRSLPPKYTAKDGITVIRPLCFVREKELRAIATENGFPVVGDEMCPAFRCDTRMPHARAEMKQFLAQVEEHIPHAFSSVESALANIDMGSLY